MKDDHQGNEQHHEPSDVIHGRPQGTLHTLATPGHQGGNEKKARTTPDRRGKQERNQRHMQHPGGDRENLIGNGRKPGNEDGPDAPFPEPGLGVGEGRGVASPLRNQGRDQREREVADQIAQQTAEHRRGRSQGREPPRLPRLGHAHGGKHHVRRNGKERGLRKTQPAQIPGDMPVP